MNNQDLIDALWQAMADMLAAKSALELAQVQHADGATIAPLFQQLMHAIAACDNAMAKIRKNLHE